MGADAKIWRRHDPRYSCRELYAKPHLTNMSQHYTAMAEDAALPPAEIAEAPEVERRFYSLEDENNAARGVTARKVSETYAIQRNNKPSKPSGDRCPAGGAETGRPGALAGSLAWSRLVDTNMAAH